MLDVNFKEKESLLSLSEEGKKQKEVLVQYSEQINEKAGIHTHKLLLIK